MAENDEPVVPPKDPEKPEKPPSEEAPKEAGGDPTVEDIAKRVAALDEGDELERIARDEEEKLAERRTRTKRGKGKGLEAAASKRLAKIADKARPKATVPDAVEAADPLIERTLQLRDWARKNRNLVQGLIVAAAVAAAGLGVWSYFDRKHQNDASSELAQAVADQRGEIGDPDKEDDTPHDKVPIFPTADDRREAALAKYREVEHKYPGTGAAWLARLDEGSLLLDKRDPDGAIAAFGDVAGSSLAKADTEVHGRALEGRGFAYELQAQLHPEGKDKAFDAALEQYKQLEALDVLGFKQMAVYHQARVHQAKGDKAKAMELLKSLREDLMKSTDSRLLSALREMCEDRMREIDPANAPAKRKGINSAGQISPEILEKLPPELRERFLHGTE